MWYLGYNPVRLRYCCDDTDCIVAYFQWGTSTEFWYIIIAHTLIQIIDGNVVVPLLFSDAVNTPTSYSYLFFFGTMGHMGCIFAIP